MRLFNNIRKDKDSSNDPDFNKEKIIKEILEDKNTECPGWNFFEISNHSNSNGDMELNQSPFDTMNCDFIAIYSDLVNKEIKLRNNPFSEYKRTVERIYQIVREIYIIENWKYIDESNQFYKRIIASSAKELFIKLKSEI